MTEVDGKATGWTAHYINGKWKIEKPEKSAPAAKKSAKKKPSKKKKAAKKSA